MISFNFYFSILFWALFVIVAFLSRFFDGRPRFRGIFLFITSSFMVVSIPQISFIHFLVLLGLASLSFLSGFLLLRSAGKRARLVIGLGGVVLVLSFLAFFKYRFIQNIFLKEGDPSNGTPLQPLFMIGVSYFSFKMIHFIVESYKKKVEGLNLLTYLNYIVFFPPFISGPINRYNHFAEQLNRPIETSRMGDWKKGGERIIHGLFKKFVLVQILYPYILGNQAKPTTELSVLEVVFGLYAYAFYFYFDFSGYTDLALGSARIMGIELPENFNRPFLRRNIRELWTNWHMSLTAWLVDYVYWPIVRKLRELGYFRARPVLLSNVGMIITFIICGMWHGEAFHFVVWGLYHGVGIAIATIYQREKRKVRSPVIQKYFRSKYSSWIGTCVTFNFFALGLALFVLNLDDVGEMLKRFLGWL